MTEVVKPPKKISKKDAIQELWNRGDLTYKLIGKQMELYNSFVNADEHINVICCSRRFGKSTVLGLVAVETCLKNPDAVVKYAAPSKIQVEEILNSIMKYIFNDCPIHLQPEWKEAKKKFIFKNGSEIQIAATDGGHIESLRGGCAHLCIVDEAGFVDDLNYAIDNVMSPATDTTGGKIILASTPNFNDPNHEFNTEYVLPRQEAGSLIKFTIFDAPMINDKRRNEIIDRYGIDNPRFKCEYMCELQVDPEKLVVGEFNQEKELILVKPLAKPDFFDCYVAMDIGFKDLTAILFMWYDYLNGAIVIEDEIIISGVELTTDCLADLIKQKEAECFRDKRGLPVLPAMRVSDNNNPILLNDLFRIHGLAFIATAKDNKDAQINELKLRIKQNRIVINPKCRTLLFHLRSAKWNKKRDGFERIKDNRAENLKGGHADALDALIYGVRNINTTRNPYPYDWGMMKGSNVHVPGGAGPKSSMSELLTRILNIKPPTTKK